MEAGACLQPLSETQPAAAAAAQVQEQNQPQTSPSKMNIARGWLRRLTKYSSSQVKSESAQVDEQDEIQKSDESLVQNDTSEMEKEAVEDECEANLPAQQDGAQEAALEEEELDAEPAAIL